MKLLITFIVLLVNWISNKKQVLKWSAIKNCIIVVTNVILLLFHKCLLWC